MGKGGQTQQQSTQQDNRILNELAENSQQLNLSETTGAVTINYRDENAVNKMTEVVGGAMNFIGDVLTGVKDTQQQAMKENTELSKQAMQSMSDNKNDDTQKTILGVAGLATAGYIASKIIK